MIVGFLMMSQVRHIDWTDLEIAIPAFLTTRSATGSARAERTTGTLETSEYGIAQPETSLA